MKAIICAAGQGKRLAPLTKEHPKALLSIGGKYVIEYIIEALSACGIAEVVVVTGYHAEVVKNFLNKRAFKCQITHVHNEHFATSDNLY